MLQEVMEQYLKTSNVTILYRLKYRKKGRFDNLKTSNVTILFLF